MNWMSLALVVAKYLPAVISFVEKEAPAVQAFVKDVEVALQQPSSAAAAGVDIGTLLQRLLPQPGGVPAPGPVLSGPDFKFNS